MINYQVELSISLFSTREWDPNQGYLDHQRAQVIAKTIQWECIYNLCQHMCMVIVIIIVYLPDLWETPLIQEYWTPAHVEGSILRSIETEKYNL